MDIKMFKGTSAGGKGDQFQYISVLLKDGVGHEH